MPGIPGMNPEGPVRDAITAAWYLGYEDGERWAPKTANPYPPDTDEHHAWAAGWWDAVHSRMK
jgi:ribosome modulation factor